jgi:hypothetical protein
MGVLPSPLSISLPHLSHPPFHITIHTTIISKYLSLRSLIHVIYCFGHWRYAINSIYPSMFLAFFLLFPPISDVSISICSWLRNNQYLEVLRFDVFQLRSTNLRRLHHNTLHSIGFSAVSSSIHHQPLSCLVPTRRSVHSTR